MVPVTNMRYAPMYLRVYNVLSIHGWSEVKPCITAENDDVIYEQPLSGGGVPIIRLAFAIRRRSPLPVVISALVQ